VKVPIKRVSRPIITARTGIRGRTAKRTIDARVGYG
jgi:hypothetical protein